MMGARRQSSVVTRLGGALLAGMACPAMAPAAAETGAFEDLRAFKACDRNVGDVWILLSELADAPDVSRALGVSSAERETMLSRTLEADRALRHAWPDIYSDGACAADRSSLECILVRVRADAVEGPVAHYCRPGLYLQRFVETEMPALEADGVSFASWADEQISCAAELVE